MTVNYLPRDRWGADAIPYRLGGADDPRGGGRRNIAPAERTGAVHHHTVGVDPDDTPNVWETLEEVKANARRIQAARPDLGGGLLDVPYNFLGYLMADRSVAICEGRGWDRSGAHTAGKSSGVYLNISQLATSWAGNFEDSPLDIEPWLLAINEWHAQMLRYAPSLVGITGHRDWGFASDLNKTACPGQSIYSRLRAFSFEVPEEEEAMTSEEAQRLAAVEANVRTLNGYVRAINDRQVILKTAHEGTRAVLIELGRRFHAHRDNAQLHDGLTVDTADLTDRLARLESDAAEDAARDEEIEKRLQAASQALRADG